MNRTIPFSLKSKARRFIPAVIVEGKGTIRSWKPISLISCIQIQNATFITALLMIPSDIKIRIQIHYV